MTTHKLVESAEMSDQPKSPWNSRERRWNRPWWQWLLAAWALVMLWGVLDAIYLRFFVFGAW